MLTFSTDTATFETGVCLFSIKTEISTWIINIKHLKAVFANITQQLQITVDIALPLDYFFGVLKETHILFVLQKSLG